MIIGYARVSTNGQDLALQRQALNAAGCEKIYEEKKSGARRDRPELDRLRRRIAPGDIIVVTRLDRLARSALDLLHIIDAIGKAGGQFRSLADRWCDTTTPHGKLILTVLAGLTEFERELIMARTKAGIERARAIGIPFGRPRKLTDRQKALIVERRRQGESVRDIARTFDVSEPSIYRILAAST
jgi:DNA invertase Pin-like site-specific DNA recombinase